MKTIPNIVNATSATAERNKNLPYVSLSYLRLSCLISTALSYLYLSLLVVGFSFGCLHFSLIFRPQLTRTFRPARFSSLHLLLL